MSHTDNTDREEAFACLEYESAAGWCASMGESGQQGSRLPEGLSVRCMELIDQDRDDFAARVRDYAYAKAMNAPIGGAS